MRYEPSNEHAPRPPLCAICAQTMRLARITSRFGGLPDLYTFIRLNAELVVCPTSRHRAAEWVPCLPQ